MCYLKITEGHLKTINKYNNKSKNFIYTQECTLWSKHTHSF